MNRKPLAALAAGAAILALTSPATAQFTPSRESVSNLFPGQVYSPYA